jgi:hypothetical protein
MMTAPPEQEDTPARWYVRTAGHRDAHDGALAMNGTVVAHRGISFTPATRPVRAGTAVAAVTGRPGAVLLTCLTPSIRQQAQTLIEADGAPVAGLVEVR